jgi:fatty-acyl-CoA synthase
MELYFAVSGMGSVIHTINPRLFPEQIAYIIEHAEDQYVFFDLTFAPLVESLAPRLPKVKGFVAMTDRAHLPALSIARLLCYEDLLQGCPLTFDWPQLDELSAAGICYTSGTTGNPKGVLYSHRSTLLHAMALISPDAFCLSARDAILPVVPMFHVNAWGIPYAAPMVGAKLVMPGPGLDGKSLYELFEAEQVTATAGVPTVWLSLLNHVKQNNLRFSTLKRTVIGGSACPPAMIRDFEETYGVTVLHAWGMTEMSPLGTLNSFKLKQEALTADARMALKAKQGRPLFGVDLKIVDDAGQELTRDGKAFGDLLVKGLWITRGYFKGEGGDPLQDGWFPTGDVATLDADGFMQITDRSKDVIKSGGEWISSIDLENLAVAHPAIAEAAVIGVRHPKWDERPLVIAVVRPGMTVTREELLAFFQGKIAKWWLPDDVVFVDKLPHTATGKLLKTALREQFKDHVLPG